MRMISDLKARFPKLFSVVAAVAALGAIGGASLYERSARASGDCCYPGSPCCHPGAACCAKHKQAGQAGETALK
jgi:hypothetical protein